MSRNDYNKMYSKKDNNTKEVVNKSEAVEEKVSEPIVETEEVVEETVSEPVVETEEVVEEKVSEPVKKKHIEFPKEGKVIGGASLNVRSNPSATASILTIITIGTAVTIDEEVGEFYKISAPTTGFVMKKFIGE